MALRFRKSFKLAPGIRMNLSGGGLSWTLGPRGASIGIGKRGTYLNAGIPGTGLYSRQQLSSPGVSNARAQAPTATVAMTVRVEDDGTVLFLDAIGNPAPESVIAAAKKQKGDEIRATIQKACDEINAHVTTLGELHLDTPAPTARPQYRAQLFGEPKPRQPVRKIPGFFAKFFKSKVQEIENQNQKADLLHEAAVKKWEAEKLQFEDRARAYEKLVLDVLAGSPDAMESFFGEVLMDITWPRETNVSFEVRASGSELVFEVDLPEVEDMPTKTASVPLRGFKLSVKEMSQTGVQKLYANHIHSIGFRLLGEAFAMLPTVTKVTLSGYSQRRSKATGQLTDEYLFSLVVTRSQWETISFTSLQAIEPTEALARFELRRDMTKTGVFRPIIPFE